MHHHTPSYDEDTTTTFADLGLPSHLVDAVEKIGYTSPTDIQVRTIPHLLQGNDIIGIAQTGTGKTAAFSLPMLHFIDGKKKYPQALILVPTRELAIQGEQAINDFASTSHDIHVCAIYGGSSYAAQKRALKNGTQIIIGTPGRIIDLLDNNHLDLTHISYFVLDEADEMLHMGFAEDVEKIASYVPPQRITALFSATMPARIRKIADQHLHEPIEIEVALPATTASTISQYVTQVIPAYKTLALTRIINAHSDGAILVFVRTRATAESLMLELTKRGIAGRVLSGDVPQNEREKIIERLKEGVLHVLVATDVAARGLDVERISLVINYDIPRDVDSYVHRIGRTGRAGRTGTALSIISPKEKHLVRSIQERTGAEITYIDVPSQAEIRKQKAQDLLTQALDELDEKTLYSYQEIVSSYLHTSIGAHPSPSDLHDIIVRLTALSLKNYDIYDDGPEHLPSKAEKSTSKKKRGKKTDKNALPYRIEVGHKDKVRPGAIVGALTHEGGLLGENIGNINIHPTFTIVDLYQPLSAGEKKKIGRIEVAGRKLSIREDTGPKKKSRKKKRKK